MHIGMGLRLTRHSGGGGGATDAISDALATRAGIGLKPWLYSTTLFTDTAGTVAASAAGDIIAVAKCLDKSLQYQQTTLANRPILTRWPKSGKRNLLTWTEDFGQVPWTLDGTSSRSGQTITFTTANTDRRFAELYNSAITTVAASTYVIKARFRVSAGSEVIAVGSRQAAASFGWIAYNTATNTSLGAYTLSTPYTSITLLSATEVSSGVWDLAVSVVSNGSSFLPLVNFGSNGQTATQLRTAGNGTGSVTVDFVQLTLGASDYPYQKVTIAQDITEAGQADCWGLTFDGTNDGMATAATLDLSGSDKVGVFAGVTKLASTATYNTVVETGTNGSDGFAVFAPSNTNVANYDFWLKANPRVTGNSYPQGTNSVISVTHDTSGASAVLETFPRVNGAAVAFSGAVLTTGNFANSTNYLGARAGTSLYFNGVIWGAAIVSTLTTADTTEIAAIEAQIADNCPTVTL